jgi:hypothetical protein
MGTTSAQTMIDDFATSTNQIIGSSMPIYVAVLGFTIACVGLLWIVLAWKSVFKLIKRYF